MVDINSNHVDDLRTLVNEDIARAICSKEGFEFVGDFEPVQQGAQAKLYTVKKNNVEYALKHYDSKSIGGYSEGFFNNPSGEFDETAFYKQLAIEDDRFKIEIALAKDDRLKKNKHIVNVAAAGRILFDDGVARQAEYYNIMEIYKPLSLDVISEPNIRNEREALRLGVQICDALITLHKCKDLFGQINYSETGRTKAILHSDIKYDNIFCYKEDNVYKYVLSDFGVSQLKATQTGSKGKGHGTAYTMAPEIASRYFSTKADLYSLCATIYLLVNKGTIFDAIPRPRVKDDVNAESGWIVIYKGTMPPPLNCTKELQELLVNGLEYDREKRNCKSAKELMTAFQKVQYTNAKKAYDEGNIEECSHFLHDLKEEDIFDNRLLSDIEQLERNKNRCGEITVCVENDEIYGVEVMGYYFERQENEDVLAFFNNRIVPELLRNEGISLKNYYYRDNVRVVNLNEFLAEKRKKEVNNNRCSTKEIPDNGIKSNDEKPDEKRTGSHRKPITTKHKNEEEKKKMELLII